MNNNHRFLKIHAFRKKFSRGWKKTRCTLCQLFFRKFRKCHTPVKRCLRAPSQYISPEVKTCHLKLKPPARPLSYVMSKLGRKATNELERMKRKGDHWTANDLFKFQHSNMDNCDADEKREICKEWLRRFSNIPKKYCYLAWYASAIYTCYYRLAPLLTDKEEKKQVWTNVRREYAEIFLMGRRIWRRPTHPTRLRILYDLAMLCVCFNDIPNDETVVLFRNLLDDHDNFNFEVLDEIEYAQSIDKTVRLENHVIDLFYQRRKSIGSARSSFHSKGGSETPRSSFRSLKMKNDDTNGTKMRKMSSLSISDMIADAGGTPGSLTPRSPQVARKPSVRFAEKSERDGTCSSQEMVAKEETEMENRILQPINVNSTDVVVTDPYITETIPSELGEQLISDISFPHHNQMALVQPAVTKVTEFHRDVTIRKDLDNVETSWTMPFTVTDKVVGFATFTKINVS